jgi:hypothetical protein
VTLDKLLDLLQAARQQCGHADYVVVGSLSILALEGDLEVPGDMTMSNDVDCWTRSDPARVFDLGPLLGEHSPFHLAAGVFLDPVSPLLPTLPTGWEARLSCIERAGLRVWFLDPNDAAVSKYARGEPRDIRWIRAGIGAGVVSLVIVKARMRSTAFLGDAEATRAHALVAADQTWFKRTGG